MSPITFKQDNVLSNQQENKTGNLSELLYSRDVKLIDGKPGSPESLGSDLDKTNPYGWNSLAYDSGLQYPQQGFQKGQWSAFMNQARLSTFYQDNPWEVLKHSKMNGYDGKQLGGKVRGWVPPGYIPGNTIDKPHINIEEQMHSRNSINDKESFGNVSFGSFKWN